MAINPINNGEIGSSVRGKMNTLIDHDNWSLSTNLYSTPIIAYGNAVVQINTSGTINPITLGGTEPFVSYAVSSGTLPPEFSLDTTTGVISYTATGATSSGSFGIAATSPVGTGDEFTVNWEIRDFQGATEFTNADSKYVACRITTSNSVDTQALILSDFYGTVDGTGNISENAMYPIWVASNGDGTWNYFIERTSSTYWYFFANCSTDPQTLTNGLVSDINTSRDYDLVAPNAQDITADGKQYPSDATDIHWITGQHFITFPMTDNTLDGFMGDGGDWSFGFRLQEDLPPDGLGRVMFSRRGRNWTGFYVGHNSTYTNLLYGNGANMSYTGDTVYPSGGFTAGQYVRCTFNNATGDFELYVDNVKYFDYSSLDIYFDDASSSDTLDLDFGYGVESNQYQSIEAYYHTFWQGHIDRLWIANGAIISSDDDGTTYPVGTTHAWNMSETTGKVFVPSIGSINGIGV